MRCARRRITLPEAGADTGGEARVGPDGNADVVFLDLKHRCVEMQAHTLPYGTGDIDTLESRFNAFRNRALQRAAAIWIADEALHAGNGHVLDLAAHDRGDDLVDDRPCTDSRCELGAEPGKVDVHIPNQVDVDVR